MSASSDYDVGDFVADFETPEEERDVAVVIRTPAKSISEWQEDADSDEDYTVADANPAYDESQPVVVVAFIESGLNERWDEWRKSHPELWDGVISNGVAFFSFPENRVSPALPEDIAEVLA